MDVASRATRREWIGLGVIALPCMLYSMDLTVLNLAVPKLTADLQPSATQLLWIVDIYGFLVAGSLITMGTLGDRIGRRRLLLLGAAGFGAASIVAAFASSPGMLIAARALLGVAGGTLAPSTLSLIRNMFHDAQQRTFAIGIWIASYSAGGALGPVLGGVLLEYFWWGSVFLLGVPVMALLLAVGPVLLPEFRDPQAGRLDIPSSALSITAVLLIIYALKGVAVYGASWSSAITLVAGITLGYVFVRRQAVLAHPLIDLSLFRRRAFSTAVATNVLGFCTAFGVFLFVAQYFQLVLGLSPLAAGLWSLPSSLAFIAGSLGAPALLTRFRPAHVAAGGLALAAAGFLVLTQVGGPASLAIIVSGSVLYALGLAPVATVATDLVVGSAPPERAGAASAISETGAEFGGAAGIALLGSIGAAVYRGTLDDGALSLHDATARAAARGTLGGALDVARELPGPAAAELIATAQAAYVDSFRLVLAVSAVIALAAAIMVVVGLRHQRTPVAARDDSDHGLAAREVAPEPL